MENERAVMENERTVMENLYNAFVILAVMLPWLAVSVRALYGVKSTPCKRVGGRYYVTAVALARWMS